MDGVEFVRDDYQDARFNYLMKDMRSDLSDARDQYIGGHVDAAKLLVDSANGKAVFAVADRVDKLIKVLKNKVV